MKSFSEIRYKPSGTVVYDKRVGRLSTKIMKDGSNYIAYIDGDRLDTYRSEKDAKKGIDFAVKELT